MPTSSMLRRRSPSYVEERYFKLRVCRERAQIVIRLDERRVLLLRRPAHLLRDEMLIERAELLTHLLVKILHCNFLQRDEGEPEVSSRPHAKDQGIRAGRRNGELIRYDVGVSGLEILITPAFPSMRSEERREGKEDVSTCG